MSQCREAVSETEDRGSGPGELEVAVEGVVGGTRVASRHDVEQQAADDGDAEAHIGRVDGDTTGRGELDRVVDPRLRHVDRLASGERVRLAGELEEQADERPHGRIRDPAPGRSGQIRCVPVGSHELALAALHLVHDRRHQPGARTEVVQQHAVARAGGGRDVAQAAVAKATRSDLVDDRNQLPKPMRQTLIKLAAWVSKQTFAVMDGNGSIDTLIEVNANIMDGLK